MSDELDRVRAAQQAFETAMQEWVMARLETVFEDAQASVVSDYVLVSRMKALDDRGDVLDFLAVHEPLGQASWVSRGLVEGAMHSLVDEQLAGYAPIDFDEDED